MAGQGGRQRKWKSTSSFTKDRCLPLAAPFGSPSLVEIVRGRSSGQAEKTLAHRWGDPEGTEGPGCSGREGALLFCRPSFSTSSSLSPSPLPPSRSPLCSSKSAISPSSLPPPSAPATLALPRSPPCCSSHSSPWQSPRDWYLENVGNVESPGQQVQPGEKRGQAKASRRGAVPGPYLGRPPLLPSLRPSKLHRSLLPC